MKRSSTLIAFAAAMILAAPVSSAVAQTPEGGARDDRQSDDPIVSLEFRGGTVGEYLDVIRRAAPETNIIADDISKLAAFYGVTLQSTSVMAAIDLLDKHLFGGPDDGTYLIAVSRIHGGSNVQPIYRLRTSRVATRIVGGAIATRGERPVHVLSAVWSLSRLTGEDGLSAEMILSVVETALAMQEDLGEPQLRYHEDTQLLIARAHPVQIEMIENVIDTLEDSQVFRARQQAEADRAAQLADQVADLNRVRDTATVKLSAANAERQQLLVRNEELQQRLHAAQQRLDESEAMARTLHAELEKLRVRLEQTRGRGDGAGNLP